MKLQMTTLSRAAALAGATPAPQASRSSQLPMPPMPPSLREQTGGFGGRQSRYKVNKGQQLRCFDPVAMRYVTFGHERDYLAWLLQRFDPSISELDAAPSQVAYRLHGRRVPAKPTLRWVDATGRKVMCFVRQSWTNEQRHAHLQFEETHKVKVEFLSSTDLSDSELLLDNLEQARQAMTNAAFAGARLACVAKAIYGHLKNRLNCTRGELGAELSCEGCLECDEYLDATLFHLHALGGVRLELSGTDYGDDTVIHPA